MALHGLIPNMNLLNIGCGDTFHTDWINLDVASTSPDVRVHDTRQGIPYLEQSFDACYSSHMLEHLNKEGAKIFLSECFRILKSKGIVRIVVPDLEAIVRAYLSALEQVEDGALEAIQDYDWMMLELYDQVVRNKSGGEMAHYLQRADLTNRAFIRSRIGFEVEKYWHSSLGTQQQDKRQPIWYLTESKLLPALVQKIRLKISRLLVAWIAGEQVCQTFEESLFLNSGEIHRWMYDRVSLRRLLEESGFVEVTVCRANESRIPDFDRYALDMIGNEIRKPDSLFMEAIKP